MSEQQQQPLHHHHHEIEEKDPPPLPNNAILDPERKLFRLRKASGGTVSRGAFGIHITVCTSPTTTNASTTPTTNDKDGIDMTDDEKIDHDADDEVGDYPDDVDAKTAGKNNNKNGISSGSSSSRNHHNWYLFIEEVIFLHERGLLQVHDEKERIMDSHALYQLLPVHGMPLAVFLVYAHLRQQTYKVVRYSAERRRLIQEGQEQQEQQQQQEEEHQSTGGNVKKRRLIPALRRAAAEATAPPLNDTAQHLAWDVYAPNARFQKKDPGLPAFSVLVTPHALPFSLQRLRGFVRDNDPVPIKVATVADHGTVILFGVTNLGAPPIIEAEKV